MKLPQTLSDNITEVIIKIIRFTSDRHRILTENIDNLGKPDFVPRDLAVDEFSTVMNNAINEHVLNQRLLFCDTDSIRFGSNGSFEVEAKTDYRAYEALRESKDKYLELQVSKMMENTLNMKLANELLKQKECINNIVE